MPGLIDAHAPSKHHRQHHRAELRSLPFVSSKSPARLSETLADGFTTVRDAGGLIGATKEADSTRPAAWSAAFRQQCVLSQTGGHGDLRPRTMGSRNRRRRASGRSGLSSTVPTMWRWGA